MAKIPSVKMQQGHYQVIAQAIRGLPSDKQRKLMSDHFGKFFAARSKSFDNFQWERATGVYVTPRR